MCEYLKNNKSISAKYDMETITHNKTHTKNITGYKSRHIQRTETHIKL